jgi:hypothetical protein
MKLPPYFEAAAWIAVYAGIGVFAFAARSPSPIYSAVFIERTRADWLPDAPIDYTPGQIISGDAPAPYFAAGWRRPEPQGRWSSGKLSSIVLKPTRPLPPGSAIEGRISAFVGGRTRMQTIGIDINGKTAASLQITPDHNVAAFRAALPAGIAAGTPVTIQFVVPGAVSPLNSGASADWRELGVRLISLVVTDRPDHR